MIDNKIPIQAWFIWFIVSIFSLLQFFLQVSGNMIIDSLKQSLHINDTKVGILCSSFFWAYILVQIPAGILLDRFGARKVLITACCLLGLGCALFSISNSFNQTLLSRLLMGIGAGFGFIGMIFSIAEWFPAKMFPLFVGLGELIGMLGTALGQRIVPYFIVHHGWEELMRIYTLIIALILISMLIFLRNKAKTNRQKNHFIQEMIHALAATIKIPVVWLAGIFCCGTFIILTAFTDIWGEPFLEHVYHFSYLQATGALVWVLLGIAIGGPVTGWISGRYNKLKPVMFGGALISFLTIFIVILDIFRSQVLISAFLFIMGFSSSVYLLAFAIVKQKVDSKIVGTAMALCNALSLIGAVLFQPLIGWLLTILQHSPFGYQAALLCLPTAIFIALIFLAGIKITATK